MFELTSIVQRSSMGDLEPIRFEFSTGFITYELCGLRQVLSYSEPISSAVKYINNTTSCRSFPKIKVLDT